MTSSLKTSLCDSLGWLGFHPQSRDRPCDILVGKLTRDSHSVRPGATPHNDFVDLVGVVEARGHLVRFIPEIVDRPNGQRRCPAVGPIARLLCLLLEHREDTVTQLTLVLERQKRECVAMGKLNQAQNLCGPLLTCDEGSRLGAHDVA